MPKKKVGSVHTAKNGAKYRIQKDGRALFISGPTKGPGSKKKKKAGSVSVAGSVRKKKAGSVSVAGSVRIAGGLKKKKKY